MSPRSWIRKLFARTPRTVRQAPACRRPALEGLEDRLVPATYVVSNNLDAGDGSLRAAIDAANASEGIADTIRFDLPAGQETITAVQDDTNHPYAFGPTAFVITDDLTIQGDPAEAGVILSGNNSHRLFGVMVGASLSLEYLTLTGGNATGGDGGGVIGNGSGGAGGGGAGLGGAVFNAGTLNLLGMTLTGNTATGGNGGVRTSPGPVVGGAGGGSAGFKGGD